LNIFEVLSFAPYCRRSSMTSTPSSTYWLTNGWL